MNIINLAAFGAGAPSRQPVEQRLLGPDYAREMNLLCLSQRQFLEQTRLIERARITVEDIAVIAIGLRSSSQNDLGEDFIAYQLPSRHRLLDTSPEGGIGSRHFTKN